MDFWGLVTTNHRTLGREIIQRIAQAKRWHESRGERVFKLMLSRKADREIIVARPDLSVLSMNGHAMYGMRIEVSEDISSYFFILAHERSPATATI